MTMNVDETLNKILDHLNSVAKTETIIGEPFKLGEFTCVPVVKIGMGFAGGGRSGEETKKDKGTGGGAGGGINITPIGFLVTRDNEISVITMEKSKGVQAIFEKVPDLLEKLMEMKKKKNKEKD
ncbi:MAG: hypothetical protein K8R58_13490 [Bacteroidales bacterium]|nr:hypothetical protein [Bacteroidales bacterium]